MVFTSGTSRIAAERLEFNTRTKTGTFYNASGSATLQRADEPRAGRSAGAETGSVFGTQEPDVYFYGETLQKLGEEKYKITHGGFTTCVQPTPRWELTSSSVTLNLEHYAILTNSLFKVKGVPLLYMPIFYYPVQKDDRATGFLIPGYGASTIRGQSLSNAFFWAISRSQDLTLMHDWFSKTGQGFGTEYRYVRAAGLRRRDALLHPREHEAQYDDHDDARRARATRSRRRHAAPEQLGPGALPRGLLLRHRGAADLSPERVRRVAPPAGVQRVGRRRRGASTTSRARSTAASISTERRVHRCAAARRGC